MPFYRKITSFSKGFTLLELLVSLAIIGMITAVVVFNQGDFSDQVSLGNVANEMDIQIREAQIYGTSVKELYLNSNLFSYAYGVSFNLNSNGNNYSYVTFADVDKDNFYDFTSWITCTPTGASGECVKINQLGRNNTIQDICVIDSNNTNQCKAQGAVGRIDIRFQRPNPTALLSFRNTSGNIITFPNHKGVKIVLQSPKGSVKNILVYTTGQVSIQ